MEMTERLEGMLLELNSVYSILQTNQRDYYETSEKAIKAKHKLETERLIGLANGTISGKNSDERDASAREVIGELFVAHGKSQDDERGAKFLLDSSAMSVECTRARLRVLELLINSNRDERSK